MILADSAVNGSLAVIGIGAIRLKADCLIKILDGRLILTHINVDIPPVFIIVRIIWGYADGFVEVINNFFKSSFLGQKGSEIGMRQIIFFVTFNARPKRAILFFQ